MRAWTCVATTRASRVLDFDSEVGDLVPGVGGDGSSGKRPPWVSMNSNGMEVSSVLVTG